MKTYERRFTPGHIQLLRSADASLTPGTITGYASTYSALSSDLGGFRERVHPNAFDKSLTSGADCYACINHDQNYCLGRRKNGTLQLSSDTKGLAMRCALPNTSYARDAWQLISRGDLSEMSFGFTVDGDDGESWDDEPDPDDRSRRVRVRTLRCVRLFDVSAVLSPAYPNTSVSTQADSTPPFFSSSRSFDSLFPEGIPAEVRSRIPDARQRFEHRTQRDTSAARRRLTNSILSI
jgi:HK97 family phage prohead protease